MRCIAVLYSKPFENFIAPYTTEYRYITLIGEAGNATALDIGNDGISIHDGAKISSTNNGNISLTGTGKGIGKSINEGIDIFNNASIESTGTGNINLTGIGNNTAEGIRLKGVIYGNKLVTLNADEINLFGSVSGTGNLYLEPQTTNLNIKLGGNDIIDPDPDPDSNSLNLTTAELNTIQNGFSSITIGRSDSTGVINVVGNVTFNDPVTLRSPFGSINVNNTITGQDASITLQGITNLKANLTTNNQNITIDGKTDLGANSTLTGSNVTFKGTINSANSLTVNASGITDFQQAIGGTTALNSLTTDAAGKTQINANVTTTGSQIYNDTVEIQNPVTLSTTNSNIAFNKTVDSQNGEANNLTLNIGTGNVNFNNSVGNTNSLGNLSVNSSGTTLFNNTVKATSLTTDAEGSSQINGDITTTGSQTYNDAVNLQGNTTLTGNNVAFQNTVDGNQALTVNSSGVTHFEKAVGNTTALNSLTTDATGTTEIKDNIKTTGNQTYNDVVTLKGNSTLTGSNLTLSNVTGTTNNFSVNAGQDIILNANSAISTGTGNVQFDAVRAINLSSGSSITTTSGTINLNANKNGTGTGRFVGINLGNSSINSQTGNITLFGQGGNTIGFGRNDGIGTGANTIETSGNIDLTGIGGAGSGSSGIDLYGGSIKATGTGNINITGTGGTGTENNEGILIYNGGKIQSTSGNINLTGFGKTGTGSEGITARSETGTIGSATTTGDISLTTDTVNLNNLTIQGSGKLTLQPDSASTSIGIGDSATGTFNLDSSELSTIQNGFNLITIGRSDSSGAINVAGNVTFNDPVTLRSPLGSINVNNTITGQGDASITLQGTTNLNANLTTSNQNITIDGNTTLGTNSILTGSNITLSNVTGTTNNFSVNAGQDIILNANSAISTGTGNVQFDAARAITLNSGSKIETDSGSINLNANKNGIGTGYFIGIGLANSSITSQTGNITLFGQGGDTSQAFLGSDGIGTGANK